MKERSAGEDRMVRYVLADASEEERTAVELELLADDQRFEELLALEDELRYDYLRGQLSPEHRKAFEARLQGSAGEREKLETARAVLLALDRTAPDRRTVAFPLAIAATLLILAGGALLLRELAASRTRLDALVAARTAAESDWARRLREEKERADRMERDLRQERERRAALEGEIVSREAAPAAPRAIVTLALAPGLLRGAEDGGAVVGRVVGRLRLVLSLPEGSAPGTLQASVRDAEGNERWFRASLARRQGTAGAVVDLEVPARVLLAADYEVVLSLERPGAAAEEVADYHFTVRAR